MPFGALLVESAVNSVIALLRSQFNTNLAVVWSNNPQPPVTLENLQISRFYVSEAIDPLQAPAIFVIADRSDHDLSAQNFAKQTHTLMVAVLVEDVEVETLTRKAWRYGQAAWLTLHDKAVGDIKILVEALSYSPILGAATRGEGRQFRKDVTLRLRVMHFESF